LRKPERRSARWIEGQSGPKFAFRVKIGSVTRKWTRLKDIYKKIDPWSRLLYMLFYVYFHIRKGTLTCNPGFHEEKLKIL
jgi:hypothetical protein